MEKHSPHYSLTAMQAQVAVVGMDAFTATAVRGGLEMGLTRAQMREVIAGLTRRDFYKSMTTYRDHRVWQDVYHARCQNGQVAYIKLTHTETQIVIQFKRK